tara:strand:- start:733 stop:1299 length:567 start_codon:yes stop_codon:yes gene_type:complete
MANFKDSPHFTNHNDYYTQKSTWQQIKKFIPENLRVFEAFCLNSNLQSAEYLRELGYVVIADNKIDCLNNDHLPASADYDVIISNPPFERIRSWKERKNNLKYKCIKKLFELNKPFCILMNSTNIHAKWFGELMEGHETDVKFIYPTKKIQYDKYEIGGKKKMETKKNACSFNSIYFTYKLLKNNHWI